MHWAIDANQQDIAFVLAGREQTAEIIDQDYMTPLMKSVVRGWHNVVDRLLERNVDVMLQSPIGDALPPFLLAIEYGHTEVMMKFIEKSQGMDSFDRVISLVLTPFHHPDSMVGQLCSTLWVVVIFNSSNIWFPLVLISMPLMWSVYLRHFSEILNSPEWLESSSEGY